MMKPVRKITDELYRADGPDGIWWLGGAGFAVRLGQRYVFIDPAVTDMACDFQERLHGFPLEPPEFVKADHVLYSHEHSDHMDRGLFPRLMQLQSHILAPAYCKKFLLDAAVPESQIHVCRVGDTFAGDGYEIEIVRSRHGSRGTFYYPEVLDQDEVSCSFLVKTKYGSIFHPGDSYYLKEFSELRVEYLLLPINDTNLGVGFAAQLTEELQPRVVIPCHYGMYAPPKDWQGGHPAEYLSALAARRYETPYTDIMVLTPGGRVLF